MEGAAKRRDRNKGCMKHICNNQREREGTNKGARMGALVVVSDAFSSKMLLLARAYVHQ